MGRQLDDRRRVRLESIDARLRQRDQAPGTIVEKACTMSASLRTSKARPRFESRRRSGSGRLPLRRRNGVAEIVQKPHGRNGREDFLEQLDPFARQLRDERAQAGDIAARTRQRGDHADARRLPDGGHDDGDGRGGGCPGPRRRRSAGHDHVDAAAHQLRDELGETLALAVGRAVVDVEVFPSTYPS